MATIINSLIWLRRHVVSRIHVDDLAGAIVASMDQSPPGGHEQSLVRDGAFADRTGSMAEGGASVGVDNPGGEEAMADGSWLGCPIEGAGCSTYLIADDEPAAPGGWPRAQPAPRARCQPHGSVATRPTRAARTAVLSLLMGRGLVPSPSPFGSRRTALRCRGLQPAAA